MNGRIKRLHPSAERLLVKRLAIDLLAHTATSMSAAELIHNRSAYMERRRELAEDGRHRPLERQSDAAVVRARAKTRLGGATITRAVVTHRLAG